MTTSNHNQFFVPLPPQELGDGGPHLLRIERPLESERSVHLIQLHQTYLRTNNPLYVLFAYSESLRLGVYPPHWVLDALAHAFTQYLDARQTEQSLDSLLGLRRGRGQSKGPFQQFRIDQQVELTFEGVATYLAYGLPEVEALKIVAYQLALSPATARNRWKAALRRPALADEWRGELFDLYKDRDDRFEKFRAGISASMLARFPKLKEITPITLERFKELSSRFD